MRRLFLHISVSVDGYIADEVGGLDWITAGDEFERHIDRLLESIDGMVFGRVAFEQLAAFWPNARLDVSSTQVRRMHELPKYVLSSSYQYTEWHNSHALGDDPAAAIVRLKRQDGRDLALFGGASAANSLLTLGVIDELRLLVHPTLLGGGTRLLDGRYPRRDLRLTDTHRFTSGALLLAYELAGR